MLRDFLSLQLTAAERKATLQDISIQKIHRRLQKLDVKGGTSFLETRKGDVVFQEKSIGLGELWHRNGCLHAGNALFGY